MAIKNSSIDHKDGVSKSKRTKQGAGMNTKYSATSRNKARKKYRGQGK